jgi:alkylation response protein AidB-like acyl-CoA dehydrogenase
MRTREKQMIDFQPTDEQQLVIDTVRNFAVNEIRPRARECDESRKLPEKVIEQAHGWGRRERVPESAGGGGERSAVTGVLVAEELAVGDLGIALAILSPALGAFPIAEFGTEEQKSQLARFVGTRFVPGSLAWVEPRFDSDPFRPQTTARREGNDYVLDGAVLRPGRRRIRCGGGPRMGRPRRSWCRATRPIRRSLSATWVCFACRPQPPAPPAAVPAAAKPAATRAPICVAC